MSCFAKIKSPLNGKSITSFAYYQLTSFFPSAQGKKIYAATTTNTFKREFGFDWTKAQLGYNPKLNFAGEPNIEQINAHLKLGLNEREIRAAQQIEEVASLGYLNVGYTNPKAFDLIIQEVNLNPKYNLIETELLVRDGKHYLSVKPVPNGKEVKPVSKDYLRLIRFPDSLINNVEDFSKATLIELMDNLLKNKELPLFQSKMIERLRGLMKINPNLRLAVFDDAEVDEQFQRSFYDPKSNTIYIGKTVASDFNTDKFVQELIHEAVHAYTISALTNPITIEELRFAQEMQKYVSEYRTKFPRLQRHYGFKNVEEFVSEYLSNPYFREDLQQAESTAKDKTFVGRVVGNIKKFLSKVLGMSGSMFDKVNTTINDYFDYLENLEDLPDLPGEYDLRFNAPYNSATANVPDSINISKFKQYVDATFESPVWKQLSQSLTEIDPRFKSIEAIKEKFGNLSTLSLQDAIISSLDYIKAVDSLLERVTKDVKLHNDNLGYYSSEDAVKVFNHAMNIADFLLEQMEGYRATLLPQLDLKMTKDDFASSPAARGEFLRDRQLIVENFNLVSKELIDKIKDITDKSDSLKKRAGEAILAPVASQLAEPFKLIAEKMQAADSEMNQEIEAKEAMLKRAVAENQAKQAADLKKDIDQLKTIRDFVPTVENIKTLLDQGTKFTKDYKGVSFFGVYLGVANAMGSPIVQSVKQFLDVHLIEAEQVSLGYTNRTAKIREKIEARNKNQGIKWTQDFGNFYQNFTREAELVYYDKVSGVRRVIKQLVYNTEFKEAEFRNDLQELERNVETAEKNGVEAEIESAQQKLQSFLETYAEAPYTPEYYEAENLLSDDARKARQELLALMAEQQAVFGDSELTEEQIETRGEYRRAYERLGSIFNEDGSEKPKGTVERDIAESIIAYKNKRKELDVIEFVIPPKVLARFEIEKNSRKDAVSNLDRKISILKININDAAALGENTQELEKELEEVKVKLEEAKKDLTKWLNSNTRTEIHPDFFEAQRSYADQIKAIFLKYGDNPLLSEAYDDLFSTVKGYRDENGVIVGTQVKKGLGARIKAIEENIENLKNQAEESRQITDEDKKKLKELFKKINDLQIKDTTLYYRQATQRISRELLSELVQDSEAMDEINKLAVVYTDEFLEKDGLVQGDLDLDEDLPNLNHPSEFGTDMHRSQLIDAYRNKITEQVVQSRLKASDWYKANHIKIQKNYIDKKTGKKITRVFERPIYIWNLTIPRNQGYITQENPNFDWSLPRVREEYKNRDYNYLGKARPKKTADNRYTNPDYQKLTQEEKEIMGDIMSLYEDMQRDLPSSQRLQGYTVPNRARDAGEKVTDLFTSPRNRFKNFIEGFKLVFKPGLPGENQDEDEISSLLDDKKNKQMLASGRKLQLIKTRFKEPLNVDQVSRNLLTNLAEFGVYTAQFAGLKKAMPVVFSARDIFKPKVPENDIKMLDEEIQRFFYGGEVQTTILGYDNAVTQGLMRLIRRHFRFSQSRVLVFNTLRLFKNIFTNFIRITLKRNKYGFTRKELWQAWWKGLKNRSSLLSLELGSKQYSEYALKLVHFRAVPSADPSKLAGNVHQTGIYKYLNLENFNSQVFGYTEMASTIPIYEAFMARMTVPMIVKGQKTMIKLDDAYDVIDGMLIPKDGVFGLEQNKVRSLVEQRKQIIETFLSKNGVKDTNSLSTKQRVELKTLITPVDISISATEASNKTKRDKLKLMEQYVRDNIHALYTSTQGNYYGRSRSAYEKKLLASMLMSMRRWLQPSLDNLYGAKRVSMYTGRIEEGFYRGTGKSLIRKLKYLASGERINLGHTEHEKENHGRVFADTVNVLAMHSISLGLLHLLLSSMAGGGDDDRLLAILAMISIGTYDEMVSLHPILGPSNWIYKTFFRSPLDKPGDDKGVATLSIKYGLYAVSGAAARSFDQIYDALFDYRNITNPFEPYYVQRRGEGGNSSFYTPDATEGVPRILAVALKVYGIEGGMTAYLEPNRRVLNLLKVNPMIGLQDPLGDYIQIEKKIVKLKKEMSERSTQDNENFENGDWDKLSKPDLEKLQESAAKLIVLSADKVLMELNNPILRGAKLEKEMSAYEGTQDTKTIEKLEMLFLGETAIKAPPHQQKEFFKQVEKARQNLKYQTVKKLYEDSKTQDMKFD